MTSPGGHNRDPAGGSRHSGNSPVARLRRGGSTTETRNIPSKRNFTNSQRAGNSVEMIGFPTACSIRASAVAS